MSECTNGDLRDLLPELVNDRLDAESRQRVEAHVASCADCADELALLRSLRPALARGPAIDVARIAAAVHARTEQAADRARVHTGLPPRWKLAIAAAALLAVSAIGYVARTHRTSVEPAVAVAPTAAAESAHGPAIATPRTPRIPGPSQQVASAPQHVGPSTHTPVALASSGVLDNVSDLSDEDVRTLTASLDKLSAVPDADPAPGIDPLGASLDDESGGRR